MHSVFCLALCCVLASVAHSLSDIERAQQLVPSPEYQGKTPVDSARVLNRHLHALGRRHGHEALDCHHYPPDALVQTLSSLLHVSLKHKDAAPLHRVYREASDKRALRHEDIAGFEAEWQRLAELSRDDSDLASLAHAGRCYEAALVYTHHLSATARHALPSTTRIPLLPVDALAARANACAHDAPTDVHRVVGAQVVCARCHVSPTRAIAAPVVHALDTRLPHADLNTPAVLSSTDGQLHASLDVDTARLKAGPLSFNVRTLGSSTPSPTLRVRAGDTITVKLSNNLGIDDGCTPAAPGHNNLYRCPNVTNVHMHGLWVAPQDVYTGAFPGSALRRSFILTPDHGPGTFWYHPHFHGSVSLHLASGMAGLVIVEDPEGSLPAPLALMKEQVLVLQSVEYFNYTMDDVTCPHTTEISRCHNLDGAGSLETIRTFSGDKLPLDVKVDDDAGYPIGGVYWLVNGQYQPRLSLKPGEWQRWRIVNAAHQAALSLSLPNCDTRVIAMDGVYLKAPRVKSPTKPLILPPGGRADVAVMCSEAGERVLQTDGNPDVTNFGQQTGFGVGALMGVRVEGPRVKMAPPGQLPPRPPYLKDAMSAPTAPTPFTVKWDIVHVINNTAGKTDVPIYAVNERPFSMREVSPCVERSDTHVEQWRLVNPIWICNASQPVCEETMDRAAQSETFRSPVTLSHGFHMHTFKFQVFNDSNNGQSLDYEPGDFRDTIMTPTAGHVDIRWVPNEFLGLVPYHCHMSPHSDRGMIALARVAETCDASASGYVPVLGNYTMPISTEVPAAQTLFDEGMLFEFGFDQDLAVEWFQRAIGEDPHCAMCFWGIAYASGPFLNFPLKPPSALEQGYKAAMKAMELADAQQLSRKEVLLIKAMAERYLPDSSANQTLGYLAFARAMLEAHKELPSDEDIGVLAAEALMVLQCSNDGYHFYDKDFKPTPRISQALDLLEGVLFDEVDSHALRAPPLQPLGLHLFVHATEPSRSGYGPDSAGRAGPVADRLRQRYNDTISHSVSQHLQHMSGHVYLRVGRYRDAVIVNEEAHRSDATLLEHGLLPYGPAHDVAFLVYAACMAGMQEHAVGYGHILRGIYQAAPDRPDGPGPNEGWNIPLTTMLRFGNWSGVLADETPMPRTSWPYAVVLRHFARGVAMVRLGETVQARAELEALRTAMSPVSERFQSAAHVANLTLSAVLADPSGQVSLLREAAAVQTSWPYNEPPDWHMPLRQCLGQALLNRREFASADGVFREDLKQFPENPYALRGLATAMQNQPSRYSKRQVERILARVNAAWEGKTVLESSCLLVGQ